MPVVYRVQDRDGRGPFKLGFSWCWQDENPPAARAKTIMDDFGWEIRKSAKPNENLGCAFRTIEQLKAYFSPHELKTLKMLGYRTVELEVDRIIAESETQVLFARVRPLKVKAHKIELT